MSWPFESGHCALMLAMARSAFVSDRTAMYSLACLEERREASAEPMPEEASAIMMMRLWREGMEVVGCGKSWLHWMLIGRVGLL